MLINPYLSWGASIIHTEYVVFTCSFHSREMTELCCVANNHWPGMQCYLTQAQIRKKRVCPFPPRIKCSPMIFDFTNLVFGQVIEYISLDSITCSSNNKHTYFKNRVKSQSRPRLNIYALYFSLSPTHLKNI